MVNRILSIVVGVALAGLGWAAGVYFDGVQNTSEIAKLEKHNEALVERIRRLEAEVKTAWTEYRDADLRYQAAKDRYNTQVLSVCDKADQMIIDLTRQIASYRSSRAHTYSALLLAEKAIIDGTSWDEYQSRLTGKKLDSRSPAQVEKRIAELEKKP